MDENRGILRTLSTAEMIEPPKTERLRPLDGFDSELAYWDRELSLTGDYPHAIRGRTEPDRMLEEFPEDILPWIRQLAAERGRVPEVLDVGSGPLSMLAYGADRGILQLTAADPLADRYRELLSKHGFATSYPLVACFGENLTASFGAERFDFVWIHNALDHSQSPQQVLRCCSEVLRPGGYLMFQGWSHEGSAESWHGLHQHDIYLRAGGRLMCDTRSSKGSFETCCLSDGIPLELVQAGRPTSRIKMWIRRVWPSPRLREWIKVLWRRPE